MLAAVYHGRAYWVVWHGGPLLPMRPGGRSAVLCGEYWSRLGGLMPIRQQRREEGAMPKLWRPCRRRAHEVQAVL